MTDTDQPLSPSWSWRIWSDDDLLVGTDPVGMGAVTINWKESRVGQREPVHRRAHSAVPVNAALGKGQA